MLKSENPNPYHTPDSNLIDAEKTSSIKIFNRFSAWFVFVLHIFSLGIYGYIWQYLRSRTINTFTKDKIPEEFMVTVSLLFFGSVAFSIYSIFQPVADNLLKVNDWLTYPMMFLNIYWSFLIRSRLITLISTDGAFGIHISGFLTFFFGPIYLQYKINEALDSINEPVFVPEEDNSASTKENQESLIIN